MWYIYNLSIDRWNSQRIYFLKDDLYLVLKMWSSESDRNSTAKYTSSRTFTPPAIMAPERETCNYENRCAILKLCLPSKLLPQWILQAKLWPLWGTAASKVSISCFLRFAEDSQSYCNLQSCLPGPCPGTLCGYFVLWWFCKSTKANPSSVEDRQIL